jgi:hypothetical protein
MTVSGMQYAILCLVESYKHADQVGGSIKGRRRHDRPWGVDAWRWDLERQPGLVSGDELAGQNL